MRKYVKLTDANSKLEVHLDPDCVVGIHHLPPETLPVSGSRPLRTKLDCNIGGRANTYFVLESPTEFFRLAEEAQS